MTSTEPADDDDAGGGSSPTAAAKARARARKQPTAAKARADGERAAKATTTTTHASGISSDSVRSPEVLPWTGDVGKLIESGAYVIADVDAYYTVTLPGMKTPLTLRAYSKGALVRADYHDRFKSAGSTAATATAEPSDPAQESDGDRD